MNTYNQKEYSFLYIAMHDVMKQAFKCWIFIKTYMHISLVYYKMQRDQNECIAYKYALIRFFFLNILWLRMYSDLYNWKRIHLLIYVQYIFIAWHARSLSQLYFLYSSDISCLIILSEYMTAEREKEKRFDLCDIMRSLSTVVDTNIIDSSSLCYHKASNCATRPSQRKCASISMDDAYQGQIRMDLNFVIVWSARVPSTSGGIWPQSFASCRSESHVRSSDATVRQHPATCTHATVAACQSQTQRSPRSVARLGAPTSFSPWRHGR